MSERDSENGWAPFELHDAEGLLWALISNVSDCVKLVDLDGRVIEWNQACETVYGWPADEVIGKRLPHVPAELRLRALADLRSVVAGDRVAERDADHARSDGSRLVARMLLVPVKDAEGLPAGVISIVREIPSDARLEATKSEFASLVSLRLTQPLASLASQAQLLQRAEIARDAPRRAAIAESVASAAEESAHFLDALAVTSGLHSGRLAPMLEPVDLAQLITEILGRYRSGRVLADFDPSLPPVAADRRLLRHAVIALIDVADRVTPAGYHVEASIHAIRGSLVLEIVDRGPHLSAEEADRLAEAPYMGDDLRGNAGGGMALSFIAGIAEAHSARFVVQPVTPSGARYTIDFENAAPRKDARQP